MAKRFHKNLILSSLLLGTGVVGALQSTSCSCSNKKIKPSISLNDNNFNKANSDGIASFNFISNFKPTNGLFNFKLLNYDENAISLKQTSSTVTKYESQYNFAVVLKINKNYDNPIKFDLEITGDYNGSHFIQTFDQLTVIRDIDPEIPEKEPRSTTRESLFDENKIAEFTFNFVTQTDNKTAKFELYDNDELSLIDNGIVNIDDTTYKGILKVKLNSEQISDESEYLFNLKISFQANGLAYSYTYQGFKCIYKIDKINFISNNIISEITSINDSIDYKFSFLHNPSDGICNVSVTSANNVVGFVNTGTTSSIIDIDSESRLCEFSLKLLTSIDVQDKYFVDIPFNLNFKFNSSIFAEEKTIDFPQQLVIHLINPSALLKYNGEKTINIANYDQTTIEYGEFKLNSELTFDTSYEQPVLIDNYEVINGKKEYIQSLSFIKTTEDSYKLVVSLNSNLLQDDEVESFTFTINTTVYARDKNEQQISGHVAFEGFEVKIDTIKEIPQELLQINNNSLAGIDPTADLSEYNTLTVPNNIIYIEQNAFNNKLPSNITKLIFQQEDSHLQEIKEGAFEGCNSLTCELKLPETLYNIGQNAFKNCYGLIGELKIPDQVINLGISAFEGCTNLTSLKLGTSQIINSNCFKNCVNLSGDLIIPSQVQWINDSAFENCVSLSKLIFDSQSKVQALGNKAFYNCKNISFVDHLPTTLFRIGKNCFEGCVNLTHELSNNEIIIHQNLSIEECAFSGCTSIRSVSLMANSTIGNSAFTNCINIERLFISKNVNKYNWTEAFFNCSKLNEIDLSEFNTVPGSWEFGSSSETFSNCAPNGTIIAYNQEIGPQLLQFMQSKGIGAEWTFVIKNRS